MQRKRLFIPVILLIQILTTHVFAYNYKDQLDSTKSEIYERIEESVKTGRNYAELSDIYDKGYYSKEELDVIERKIEVDTQAAIDAFLKDHPEIYWLKFGEGGVGVNYNIETIGSLNIVADVFFQIVTDEKYEGRLEEMNKALWDYINEFDVYGENRYEKVKSIHDRLIEMVEYDGDFIYSHEAVGALVYGKAVCEGYAKAFKLLCDRERIPNVLVIGKGITSDGREENHMWNYVQMDDGNWYAVDVTWDDQEPISYDYFLAGSKTNSFGKTHLPNGDFSGISKYIFTYPPLEENAYVLQSEEPSEEEVPKERTVDAENKESNGIGKYVAVAFGVCLLGIVFVFVRRK